MLPWVVLMSLVATCGGQHNSSDCTNGGTGTDCNTAKYEPLESNLGSEVELEVEYLCKEATRVILHWRSKTDPISGIDEYGNYYVNLYLADKGSRKKIHGEFTEPGMPFMKFISLTPNTTYSFGIMLRAEGNKEPMEIITKNTYTTLAKNFRRLPNVTHCSISNLSVYGDEVRTNFSWTPVPENVCSYEIVVINLNGTSPNEHPQHIISRPQELQTVEITGMRFGSFIHVGVYATIEDESLGGVGHVEGRPFWITFKTPHCAEIYGWNYNICKPEPPKNVTASVKGCLLNVAWDSGEHPPPFYQIYGYPTNPNRQGVIRASISGAYHRFMASTRDMGEYFIIIITGHSHAGSGVQTKIGIENDCTPEEAAKPYGPPIFYHNGSVVNPTAPNGSGVMLARNDYASHMSDGGDSFSTTVVKFVTGGMILLAAVLGAHAGFKYYREWKDTAPQPLQESCEMAQPLARNKPEDNHSESAGEATTEEDTGEFEVKRQSLHLKEVVGEGEFGVVRRAILVQGNDKREVAVKMLRDDASGEDKKQLRLELEVMKSVGTHNNIVCLVGFCSSSHMLVVEYCSLGDLQNYLRDIWRSKNWAKDVYKKNNPARSGENENVVSNLLYSKTEVEKKQLNVTIFDLISLARQVALGMEYLSSNKVVHRDLAARNILLNEDYTAKISDFGLSRDVYEENMYRHKGVRRLPVKWMALECLGHQMFTTQSDVWSFGILLWEILTLGGCPYPALQSTQVYRSLLRGERLERPKLCPENLYEIMYECWDSLPHQRPTFSQLVKRLEALMQTYSQHTYLKLDEVMVSYSHLYDASLELEDQEVMVIHPKHDYESHVQQPETQIISIHR